MKLDSVIRHKNREYVTIEVFAERCNVSVRAIYRHIANGKLQAESIKGSKAKYLDWKTQSKNYQILSESPKSKAGKKSAEKKEEIKNRKYVPLDSVESIGINDNIKVDDIDLPKDIELEDGDVIDLSKIDLKRYSDCWILKDGEAALNPVTGEPLIDYKKLQDRLRSETYDFKLQRERGLYISKADISMAMQNICRLLNTGLESVPNRFTSLLIAEVRKMTGHEFSQDERNRLKNHIKHVPAEIMKSIQKDIAELTDSPIE